MQEIKNVQVSLPTDYHTGALKTCYVYHLKYELNFIISE